MNNENIFTVTSLKSFIEACESKLKSNFRDKNIRLYYRGEDKDNKEIKCLTS